MSWNDIVFFHKVIFYILPELIKAEVSNYVAKLSEGKYYNYHIAKDGKTPSSLKCFTETGLFRNHRSLLEEMFWYFLWKEKCCEKNLILFVRFWIVLIYAIHSGPTRSAQYL